MSSNNFLQTIFSIDYYSTKPNRKYDVYYSKFRDKLIYKIPIIRIFGETKEGKKSCLHIHGVFPYMLIPCDSSNAFGYARTFANEFDEAINASFNNMQGSHHIYDIKPVNCKSFYGYKEQADTYLKIFFYNPFMIKRAVKILETCKIANKKIQPYEVHLPFILQFCVDYNLFGMNNIEVNNVQFRHIENKTSNENDTYLYKETSCEIECDTLAINIVKQNNTFGPEELNPGLAALWHDENNRRNKENLDLLSYNDDVAQYSFHTPTKSHNDWKKKLNESLDASNQSLTNSNSTSRKALSTSSESSRLNLNDLNNQSGPDQDSVLGVDLTQLENEDDQEMDCPIEFFDELDDSSLPFYNSLSNSPVVFQTNSSNKSQLDIYNFDRQNLEFTQKFDKLKKLNKSEMLPHKQKFNLVLDIDDDDDDDKILISGDPYLPKPIDKPDEYLPVPKEDKFWFDPRYTDSASLQSLFFGTKNISPKINQSPKFNSCSVVLTPLRSHDVKKLKLSLSRQDLLTLDANARQLECKPQVENETPKPSTKHYSRRKILKKIPPLDGAWDSSPERSQKKNQTKKKNSPKKVYRPLNVIIRTNTSPKKKNRKKKANSNRNDNSIAGPSKISESPKLPLLKLEHAAEHTPTRPGPGPGPGPSSSIKSNLPSLHQTVRKRVKEKLEKRLLETAKKMENSEKAISTPMVNYVEKAFSTSSLSPISHSQTSSPLSWCREFPDSEEIKSRHEEEPNENNDLELTSGIVSFYDASQTLFDMSQIAPLSPAESLHALEPLIKAPTFFNLDQTNFTLDKQPFYGKSADVTGPLIYRGRVYQLKSKDQIIKIDAENAIDTARRIKFEGGPVPPLHQLASENGIWLEPLFKAPMRDQLKTTFTEQEATRKTSEQFPVTNESLYQVQGPSMDNTFGFRLSISQHSENNSDNLNRFGLEVHCKTRGTLKPDPKHDELRALFYSVDVMNKKLITGLIYVNVAGFSIPWDKEHLKITCVPDERNLIRTLINLVQKYDPDLLIGYEVECMSWGYFCERAIHLGLSDVETLLSRVPHVNRTDKEREKSDSQPLQWSKYHLDSAIPGRVILNVWRILRHEVTLGSYTFESMFYHIMHQRSPHYSYRQLTLMWEDNRRRLVPIEYYLTRVEGSFAILDRLDIISTTSELARVFGIQFYQVLARGSQFRVESMMFRSAKPFDYALVSPSPEQRDRMREPQVIPYIVNPEPKLHTEPVIVLDFQSLYPSIMIAYNYCYSTCLGRVEYLGSNEKFEFGCVDHAVSPEFLRANKENLNFSPVGVAFVNQKILVGILPRMLSQILSTRIMVKNSLKANKDKKHLKRTLHARQLGLKLIANVTYGYTAANFSGRMPCVEIGDSIVSKARETLERAIELVNKNKEWRAKVIYGDTDSLFVSCPGRTVKQAFEIGREIADAVSQDNPKPILLKLEKVYQPLILQTMKKYVGYSYETPDQEKPTFDSKGIETVRRDGCPVATKILEKSLHILFDTFDASQIKSYVQYQLKKILSGRSNMQDFIFAKEFRGFHNYSRNASVPALELARRSYAIDPRDVPRSGDRVPYVIVHGQPGALLVNLVRSPGELLDPEAAYRINLPYYFSKHILPPLERSLALIGADVHQWFSELPRPNMAAVGVPKNLVTTIAKERRPRATLSQFFIKMNCLKCGNNVGQGREAFHFCTDCIRDPQTTTFNIVDEARKTQRRLDHINQICDSCCGIEGRNHCDSWDCPILFRKNLTFCEARNASYIESLIKEIF